MKLYQSSEIKNIALVGGAKSGKTTLAEAMAFEGKVINRRGSVEDQNTVSDYRDIEMEKENSVTTSIMYTEYNNNRINIVDTPGYSDYQGEVAVGLSAVETALVVINSQVGIEVGSEIAFKNTEKLGIPMIFAVNQLDQEKANFDEQIREMKEYLGAKVTLVQYPVNAGVGFDAVIDLILQKMLKFPKDGGKPEVLDIPDSEKDKAEELRLAMVENAASGSDDLMEKYFEEGDLSVEEVREGLRLGIASRGIYPVLCVAAKANMGVERLMEFITYNVPGPKELATPRTLASGDPITFDTSSPALLHIFKTSNEPHLGELAFMKVLQGEITEGMEVINSKNQTRERISQIFINSGKNRVKVTKAYPGDIISTIKLKDSKTNSTLTASRDSIEVSPIEYPTPIYSTAIRAVTNTDDEKVGGFLNEYAQHDRSLKVEVSRETKETIVSGMGELHINTLKWFFDNQYKIDIEFFEPKVPYRETLTKSSEASYRHRKQSGGAGQFGEVHMMIEPYFDGMPNQKRYPIRGTETHELAWGGKLVINNCIVGGAIDNRFMPAILKGIMERMEEGPLTGSYARDIVVNIFDGKMHPVDSNEMAFKLAGRNAFREAFRNAGPKILEPIYDITVEVPGDLMGGVMTDLQGRRAIVMGMDSEGRNQIIKAQIPIAEMYRYATALSSLTSGRGTYSMKFKEYQQVPVDVQNALLKAYEDKMGDED